ncbi:response regulator [Verrucomicrobia bacterium]|nr:response regulator [Verrucomicrobiota bacterium]
MLNVLIVDSDEKFQAKLASMIRSTSLPDKASSVHVTPSNSLRDAIEKVETQQFDVILTDITLSDASGFLVLEELIEYSNRCPIIVLSNLTNWSVIIESAQVGIQDFLIKKTLDAGQLIRSMIYARERSRLERKVSKAESIYESLVDILPVGLFRTDKKGILSYVNDNFGELMKCPASTLIGQSFNDIFENQSAQQLIQNCEKSLITGQVTEMEIPIRVTEDSEQTVLFIGTPIHDEFQAVEGLQGVMLDVTQQKQIQSQKEAANALALLQSSLSNVTCELNNAMTPVLLNAEILSKNLTSKTDLESLQHIEDSVHKARSVMRPFLVTSHRLSPRSEQLDPKTILMQCIQTTKGELPPHLQLKYQIAENLDGVFGDASQLAKMLNNLLQNAIESMPESGIMNVTAITEDLEYPDKDLDILGLKSGKYLHITVDDEGDGIAQHMRQRIFEPFFTTKEKSRAGIGLSEALSIVKSHGGNLKITRNTPKGTRFHVYLPITHNDIVQNTGSDEAKITDSNQPRKLILCVDDEEHIIDATTILLEAKGYDVLSACNGAEALTIFTKRQSDIDLIITDFSMPVMDGPTLIKAIKELAPRTNIILCTGIETEENLEGVENLEINGTMFKPFTSAALFDSIDKALRE